jgi:ABC-type lipoprotein release transport system permease subunit
VSERLAPRIYLGLALRNLWASPRRTGLTLGSMMLGIAALTVLGALNDGWLRQMQDNFVLALTGHVQIHAKGFEHSQDLGLRILDTDRIRSLIEADGEVTGWTRRIRSSGLATRGGVSAGIQIMGVDPEQETWVTHMHHTVRQGEWLKPGLQRDLLLGSTVAQNLGAEPGDRVVLTAQTPDGGMTAEVFYLRGIVHAGAPQIDRALALINIDSIQQWLDLEESVTDVVLRARSHDASADVQRRFATDLDLEQFEVMGWQDLDPMVEQWLKFSRAYGLILILVVAALVLVEVLNTLLMALNERTRELGILSALGTRGRQLFIMVLLEGLILIGLGAVLGYALGALTVAWLAADGVDLGAFANAFRFFYMSPVIHPLLTLESALRILGTTALAALLAGLYPAWKASGIRLQDAARRA